MQHKQVQDPNKLFVSCIQACYRSVVLGIGAISILVEKPHSKPSWYWQLLVQPPVENSDQIPVTTGKFLSPEIINIIRNSSQLLGYLEFCQQLSAVVVFRVS